MTATMTTEWFGAELHKVHGGRYNVIFDGVKVGHIAGQPWLAVTNDGDVVVEGTQRRADAVFALLTALNLFSHRFVGDDKCRTCGLTREAGKHLKSYR